MAHLHSNSAELVLQHAALVPKDVFSLDPDEDDFMVVSQPIAVQQLPGTGISSAFALFEQPPSTHLTPEDCGYEPQLEVERATSLQADRKLPISTLAGPTLSGFQSQEAPELKTASSTASSKDFVPLTSSPALDPDVASRNNELPADVRAKYAILHSGSPPAGPITPTISQVFEDLKSNAAAIRRTEEMLAGLLAQQQSLMRRERALEEQHVLQAIPLDLGYHRGCPVVSLLIHRCCIQWGVYQQDQTNVFEQVLATISRQVSIGMVEGTPKSRLSKLAYWLAATSTLLYCVHRTLLPSTPPTPTARGHSRRKGSDLQTVLTTGWDRFVLGKKQSLTQSPQGKEKANAPGGGVVGKRRTSEEEVGRRSVTGSLVFDEAVVEMAPSPASAFLQHLDALTQQVYHATRDLVRKHVQVLLPACAQIPQDVDNDTYTIDEVPEAGNTDARLAQYKPWCRLQSLLHETLDTFDRSHIPPALTRSLVEQLLTTVDVHLFNQLLLRPECCSTSNAKYIAKGVKMLDSWLCQVGQAQVGNAYFHLRHLRQACALLVTEHKAVLSWRDISEAMCPSLNVQQLYRLCTTCWDDSADAESVSGEVLEEMKRSNVQSNGGLIVTFLLDEDHTLPFAASGRISPETVQLEDGSDVQAGLPVPDALMGPGIPKEVFAFLEADLHG